MQGCGHLPQLTAESGFESGHGLGSELNQHLWVSVPPILNEAAYQVSVAV